MMNSLREALQEYIDLRRGLGYKMHDEGLMLPRFVSFMEEHHAEHISARLALEWAQSASVQPAEWARRLCFVRGFARHRSATDNLTEIPPPGPACRTDPSVPKRTCTPTMKSGGCWMRRWSFQWPGRPHRYARGCFMD
jgi:hypothetical protein